MRYGTLRLKFSRWPPDFSQTENSAVRSVDLVNPPIHMRWIGQPIAKIWPFEIFKMAAGRHLGFYLTGSSAVRSADPENPTPEPNTKYIGSPIAEICPFEFFKMAAGRHL